MHLTHSYLYLQPLHDLLDHFGHLITLVVDSVPVACMTISLIVLECRAWVGEPVVQALYLLQLVTAAVTLLAESGIVDEGEMKEPMVLIAISCCHITSMRQAELRGCDVQVEAALAAAHARRADAEEGRNVFEEGNAFTLEALQQEVWTV